MSTISATTPGNGRVAEPGLVGDGARQRRDHDHARLGLPPGIDDRAALLADHLVIPHPRFRIDRLADRAQQAQARQVVLVRPLVAPLDEGADGGRRRVEDVDAVLLDDLPEAILARMVRGALVHHRGRAVGQRAVDDVAVARHPADVGGTPVGVVLAQVEDPLMRQRRRRAGSRPWCAARPWVCRSSRWCRGCTADVRCRAARRGSRRRRRPSARATTDRGRASSSTC